MELEVKISEKLKELIDNGTIDKIVSEKLTKSLASTLDDVFASYGDFNQNLKKLISEALVLRLQGLPLEAYAVLVSGIVQQQLNNTLFESTAAIIKRDIESVLGVLEKKEWKISEIVDEYKKNMEDYEKNGSEIYYHCELERYANHIGFGPDTARTVYSAKYFLSIDKKTKEFNHFTIDGRVPNVRKGNNFYGFDSFLFKLWANGVTIIIDDVSTYFYED